jgi:riboflavin kinase/FMN adenylyltransferase
MKIIENYTDLNQEYHKSVVAIGNFDGIHNGHKALIRKVVQLANQSSRMAGLISFTPHPRVFFSGKENFSQINDEVTKQDILRRQDLDILFKVKFNKDLSLMPPDNFFYDVLKNGINVSHIVVGSDFRFGHKRLGNTEILGELSKENNIGFDVIEKQANNSSKTYSSSAIREYLLEGNISEANKMLGHYWYTMGVVIAGANKGNQIGFPTINIKLDGSIKFAHGIYATNVYLDSKRYQGATYYGKRPTYDGTEEFLETYIFDFDSNIYDNEVKIEFIDFVRCDQTYESDNKLKNQMKIDCENVLIKLQYYDKKLSLLDK